jgi:hypothetical protein
MATEADVRAIALSLPGTTEEQWYQTPGYKVAGKGFLRFRAEAEGGLVVFVSDLGEKEALLTSNPDVFFTTPHYDGWPIVLVNLDEVDDEELRELIKDSWLIKAPPELRRQTGESIARHFGPEEAIDTEASQPGSDDGEQH